MCVLQSCRPISQIGLIEVDRRPLSANKLRQLEVGTCRANKIKIFSEEAKSQSSLDRLIMKKYTKQKVDTMNWFTKKKSGRFQSKNLSAHEAGGSPCSYGGHQANLTYNWLHGGTV